MQPPLFLSFCMLCRSLRTVVLVLIVTLFYLLGPLRDGLLGNFFTLLLLLLSVSRTWRLAVTTDRCPRTHIYSRILVGERPEICAWGLRNPFRCAFDKETDELYCGDVGQDKIEEVDIVE